MDSSAGSTGHKFQQTAPVPRSVPLSRLTDNFLDGTSSVYLEELQRAWEVDPQSVDDSWDNFFRNFVGQASTSPGISGQTIQESMRLLLLVKGLIARTWGSADLPKVAPKDVGSAYKEVHFRGVRKRPWGRFAAEIRDPMKKTCGVALVVAKEPVVSDAVRQRARCQGDYHGLSFLFVPSAFTVKEDRGPIKSVYGGLLGLLQVWKP